MKYYSDGGEQVYGKIIWQDKANETGNPVIVELQKREVGGEMMWCAVEGDFCISSEQCGKKCPNYCPCNGKNGRCTELKACFVGTGVYYRITEKGNVRRVKEKGYDRKPD
jgi:hypothetical protein